MKTKDEIDELLEFEARSYIEGRNIKPSSDVKITRRGHQKETINIEVEPSFAFKIRKFFGYNQEKISNFFEKAAEKELQLQ